MRILSIMVAFAAALVLSSCLTIEERITLARDGSGTYQTYIDLSEMMSSPFMKMALEEELNKGDEAEIRVDSVIDVYSALAEANPQWTAEENEMMKRLESRMVMDLEEGEGFVEVGFPFGSVAELERMSKILSEANEPEEVEGEDDSNPFGGFGGSAGGFSTVVNNFTWKKGRLGRISDVPTTLAEELGMEDEESVGMMKMMFADAKIVYVMEFPGKVKKVKGFPGHTIEGKTVRQEFNFLDLLDDPESIDAGLDGEIRFK